MSYQKITIEVGQVDETRQPHCSVYGVREGDRVGLHLRFINAPTMRQVRQIAKRLRAEYEAAGEIVEMLTPARS